MDELMLDPAFLAVVCREARAIMADVAPNLAGLEWSVSDLGEAYSCGVALSLQPRDLALPVGKLNDRYIRPAVQALARVDLAAMGVPERFIVRRDDTGGRPLLCIDALYPAMAPT